MSRAARVEGGLDMASLPRKGVWSGKAETGSISRGYRQREKQVWRHKGKRNMTHL